MQNQERSEKLMNATTLEKSAYWKGFQETCSKFGVNSDTLLKIAGFRVPRRISLKGFQSVRPNSSSFRALREKAPVYGSKRIIPAVGKLTSLVGSGLLAGRVGGSLIRPPEQETSSVPTVNDSESGIHFDPGIIPSAPLNEAKGNLSVGNFNEPTIAERKQDFMNRLRNIKSIKDVSRYEGQNLSEGNTGLALTGNAVPNE